MPNETILMNSQLIIIGCHSFRACGMERDKLCSVCKSISLEKIEESPDGLTHHQSLSHLEDAAAEDCPLCSIFLEAIKQKRIRKFIPKESWKTSYDVPITLSLRRDAISVTLRISWLNTDEDKRSSTLFDLSADRDTLLDDKINALKLRVHVPALSSSPSSFELILDWLKTCSSSHKKCKPNRVFTPKRLIDVGSPDGCDEPRLIETRSAAGVLPYVALSYCWGTRGNYITSSRDIEEKYNSIPMSDLPQSIQDAIIITRRTGFRYMWVDAICIIQGTDSIAVEDWQTQSALMGEIFGNSAFTLAAAASRHVYEGIFHKRRLPQAVAIPYQIYPDFGAQRHLYISAQQADFGDRGTVFDEPLYKRAWALQERILSKKVVTYGTGQITWQCQSCSESENGSPPPETTRSLSSFDSRTLGITWPRITCKYSKFEATRKTDKLPALSGLVKTIQLRTGFSYLAGLWKENICNDLLWRAEESGSLIQPSKYRAPSWSWASLDGAITNTPREGQDLAQLLDYGITHAGIDSAGELAAGWIKMKGPLTKFLHLGYNTGVKHKVDILDKKGSPLGSMILDVPSPHTRKPGAPYEARVNGDWLYIDTAGVFGLQTKPNAGVVLTRCVGGEENYLRLGMFTLNASGKIWFRQAEGATLRIF